MEKRAYILVHGCFMGGWSWQPVAERLQAKGHRVYYPSLDGCGDRTASLRPGITVGTQARELAQLLFMEDLHDVHLVGTSTGGLVVNTTAALARDRVAHITLVDAIALFPGERLRNAWPDRPGMDKAFESDGVSVAVRTSPDGYAGIAPDRQTWIRERHTPQPQAVMNAPMEDCGFWRHAWPATVIFCKQSKNPGEAHQRRTAERLGARWRELDTGHYPFLSTPDELTGMLLE